MNSNQQSWHALDVTADAAAAEAIEYALNDLEALGTEINNLGRKASETLTIVGYFNAPFADTIVRAALLEAVQIYGFTGEAVRDFRWREVANEDWLAEWKKHWKPTETARFVIAPTWETVAASDKFVIRIEPSMAFGTGTHETTRLCLRAIEETYEPAESFLDVGTGTGILAIAAAKMRAAAPASAARGPLLACDTDEDSVRIAIENAALNDAAEIEFYAGSIGEATPAHDFVCANLTADVILPLLPLLVAKSKKTLVLSGILKEQERSVAAALEALGVRDARIETDGEWIAVRVDRGREGDLMRK